MDDISQKDSGFGIGELGRVPADTGEQTRPLPKKTFVCERCGGRFPLSWAMSSSTGTVCPDCYDAASL